MLKEKLLFKNLYLISQFPENAFLEVELLDLGIWILLGHMVYVTILDLQIFLQLYFFS